MRSLDFEEFLWAKGYDSSFVDEIYQYLINLKELPPFYLKLLFDLFEEYLLIGGLPEAVFKYAMLGHGARYHQYYPCVQWIRDAGLINIVNNLKRLDKPLSINKLDNNFRMYFSDTTLFLNQLDKQDKEKIRIDKDYDIFNGAFYENVICEALIKQEFEPYFYKSEDATVELDVFLRVKDGLVPIEVKRNRGRSSSLKFILDKKIPVDIKLSKTNISHNEKIINILYALTFLLQRFFNESPLFNYHR